MADPHLTKACRDCGESKPVNQFSKKERGILGVRAECNECRAIARRQRYATDPEYRQAILEKQRLANASNPIRNRTKVREWAKANRERVREYQRQYVLAKPEANRAWQEKYRRQNRHAVNAKTAHRAATKRSATPAWADRDAIKAIYKLASETSARTGMAWHVDHVVPLRSRLVCGLHVHQNMQILPARENKLKGNQWWPDMWEPL